MKPCFYLLLAALTLMGCQKSNKQALVGADKDNHGCIALSENPIHHKRTKHIDVRFHYTREKVEDGTVKLEYIPSENQVADILTKPLGQPLLVKHRGVMME